MGRLKIIFLISDEISITEIEYGYEVKLPIGLLRAKSHPEDGKYSGTLDTYELDSSDARSIYALLAGELAKRLDRNKQGEIV